MKEKLYIVYRGPLERTRLAFIFEFLLRGDEDVHFIWIFPGRLTEERANFSLGYLQQYFQKLTVIEHTWKQFFSTVRQLKRIIGTQTVYRVAGIGYSSLVFLYPFRKHSLIWFINGIPEEKTMHSSGIKARVLPKLLWRMNAFFAPRPDVIITVSKRMSSYVSKYFHDIPVWHAPTCADLGTFRNDNAVKKGYFVYCGSGAPWQAIDLMKAVWDEIHILEPSIKFRVISRDPRCKVLAENIPASNIELVQSNDHQKVAEYLWDCNVAFMLRRQDIVNQVCFPTKFAQYIAAGCAVVTTNIDWDVKDYLSGDIGLMVDPDDHPKKIAEQIVSFYRRFKTQPKVIAEHATKLDRKYWVQKLKQDLETKPSV